jgi:hypothetical protein
VGGEQRRRRRVLVVLADFQPEHPVFHHVRATDSVCAGLLVERLDEFDGRERLAVERDRVPVLELDLDQFGLGRVRGILRPLVDVLRWDVVGIFQLAALDRPAPEVRVDRPDARVTRLHGEVVFLGVLLFPLAGEF